ncbi:MAG TPA: hypothetical protein VEB18_00600 [Candidatus Paceibacterota bacterium]|nr:hypothetical protein [Candidatus Paceibacterota bacterium]
MKLSQKQLILAALAVVIVLGIAWFVSQPTPATAPESNTPETVATTTETTGTETETPRVGGGVLPPELPFVLPQGATRVDEYSYIENNTVFFRSLTGNAALAVPDADAETFKRLNDFTAYTGANVIANCGAAPQYAFYVDNTRAYFYQVWRTPSFRATQVDAMIGTNPDRFRITGATTSTDGNTDFTITYRTTDSGTCRLFLEQTPS